MLANSSAIPDPVDRPVQNISKPFAQNRYWDNVQTEAKNLPTTLIIEIFAFLFSLG